MTPVFLSTTHTEINKISLLANLDVKESVLHSAETLTFSRWLDLVNTKVIIRVRRDSV